MNIGAAGGKPGRNYSRFGQDGAPSHPFFARNYVVRRSVIY